MFKIRGAKEDYVDKTDYFYPGKQFIKPYKIKNFNKVKHERRIITISYIRGSYVTFFYKKTKYGTPIKAQRLISELKAIIKDKKYIEHDV
jgi:hypothetical protein